MAAMAEPIILASASTARARLLAAAGVPFSIEPAAIDEERIKNASRELSAARAALNTAVERQSAFVLHGTVPDDLYTQPRKRN